MMKAHVVPIPLQADWHASDRPPLQTGIYLSQFFSLIGPSMLAYQVLCVTLQSLWIFALWLLLHATGINAFSIRLVLGSCLFSSFVFVNSSFVWPKLLASSYLLGFMALFLGGHLRKRADSSHPIAIVAGCLLGFSLLSHGGSIFAFMGLPPLLLFIRHAISLRNAAIAVVTLALLYFPWVLFQKFYDPPGDRLVKMHVAGVGPIDNRSSAQAILDAYHSLPLASIVDYKRKNLKVIFETFQFWPAVKLLLFQLPPTEPAHANARLGAAKALNAIQFFYFPSTLGFYVLGFPLIPLGIFPRWRSREASLAMLLLAFTLATDFCWAILMFGPGTTGVHSGTYTTILVSFAAGILGMCILSKWLAASVAAAQISLFVYVNAFVIVPREGKLQYGLVLLFLLAVTATAGLLVQLKSLPTLDAKLSL